VPKILKNSEYGARLHCLVESTPVIQKRGFSPFASSSSS